MIRSVQIENFKSLRNVKIELERFTVLVGANGSGKSSVLEAIHNLVRAHTGDPKKVFAHERHGDWVYTRGGTGLLSIACHTDEGGESFGLTGTAPRGFPPPSEDLQKGRWEYKTSGRNKDLGTARSLVFLHLDAAQLAMPSYYAAEGPPRVEHTGEGLASVLAYIRLNDPDGFDELVEMARTLIPRLRRIRFRKAPVFKQERELVTFGDDTVERDMKRSYQGDLILFDFEHAENVSARTASEGTMLMLGLVTVLLGPVRPKILLLDDIEHGLHPLAQKQLVDVVRQIMGKFPDLQLLATAHSPYLLNHLLPEQVRIMAVGPDGYAKCGRLTDHPKFPTWKEEMAAGEMWSLFGEKWLTDEGAGQ